MSPLTEQLVLHHDLDDTRDLLDAAKRLPDEEYRAARLPGSTVLGLDGPDESMAAGAARTSCSPRRSGWPRSRARDFPPERADDPATLIERHEDVAPRWLRDGARHRAPRRLGRPG